MDNNFKFYNDSQMNQYNNNAQVIINRLNNTNSNNILSQDYNNDMNQNSQSAGACHGCGHIGHGRPSCPYKNLPGWVARGKRSYPINLENPLLTINDYDEIQLCHGCANVGHTRPNCPYKQVPGYFAYGTRRIPLQVNHQMLQNTTSTASKQFSSTNVENHAQFALPMNVSMSSTNINVASASYQQSSRNSVNVQSNSSIDMNTETYDANQINKMTGIMTGVKSRSVESEFTISNDHQQIHLLNKSNRNNAINDSKTMDDNDHSTKLRDCVDYSEAYSVGMHPLDTKDAAVGFTSHSLVLSHSNLLVAPRVKYSRVIPLIDGIIQSTIQQPGSVSHRSFDTTPDQEIDLSEETIGNSNFTVKVIFDPSKLPNIISKRVFDQICQFNEVSISRYDVDVALTLPVHSNQNFNSINFSSSPSKSAEAITNVTLSYFVRLSLALLSSTPISKNELLSPSAARPVSTNTDEIDDLEYQQNIIVIEDEFYIYDTSDTCGYDVQLGFYTVFSYNLYSVFSNLFSVKSEAALVDKIRDHEKYDHENEKTKLQPSPSNSNVKPSAANLLPTKYESADSDLNYRSQQFQSISLPSSNLPNEQLRRMSTPIDHGGDSLSMRSSSSKSDGSTPKCNVEVASNFPVTGLSPTASMSPPSASNAGKEVAKSSSKSQLKANLTIITDSSINRSESYKPVAADNNSVEGDLKHDENPILNNPLIDYTIQKTPHPPSKLPVRAYQIDGGDPEDDFEETRLSNSSLQSIKSTETELPIEEIEEIEHEKNVMSLLQSQPGSPYSLSSFKPSFSFNFSG